MKRPAFPTRLGPALLLLALAGCGGGVSFTWGDGFAADPAIAITQPTTADNFSTDFTQLALGGSVARASFVRVRNLTTGATVTASVSYANGAGSWLSDPVPLQPGANVLVATADADGLGGQTASDVLTVTRSRPL